MLAGLVIPMTMGNVMSRDHSFSAYQPYLTFLVFLTGIVAVVSWLNVIVSVLVQVKSAADRERRPPPVPRASASKVANAYEDQNETRVRSCQRPIQSHPNLSR